MRIVLVVPRFPTLSETFIVSKFTGLVDQGLDVHVVCGRFDPQVWGAHSDLAARPELRRRIHETPPTRPTWVAGALMPLAGGKSYLARPSQVMRYLRQGYGQWGHDVLRKFYLDSTLITLQPDLIHFEFGTLAVGRMHLKRLLGARIVVSFRGFDLNFAGLDNPGYYDSIWEGADALHLLGEDLWKRAQRRGCPPDMDKALIPPAIDTGWFDPGDRGVVENVGSPTRPLRILSVGRLEWKKGYEYGLAAVKRLVEQGVACEYRIIGDGTHLEAVSFARHQMGLDGVVELQLGRPRAVVREQMKWADVFLHTAVSEGFCNAVLEAQAMQLPVVCSDADGLPENVADGETGWVVPRRDPEATAARLQLLAEQPAMRADMGAAGRRRVCTLFQLSSQIGRFRALYERVLSKDARG